jgi:hypothetical protein
MRRWGFPALVLLLIAAAVLVAAQRARIRAYWWAGRLQQARTGADVSYYAACLASLGPAATNAVAARLRDSDEQVRTAAVWILAQIDDPTARGSLLAALDDPAEDVRVFAAVQLGIAAETATLSQLVERARGANESAVLATLALEKCRLPGADQALAELATTGRTARIRAQAVDSLGRRRSPDVTEVLLRCLDDPAPFAGALPGEIRDQRLIAAAAVRLHGAPTTGPSDQCGRTVSMLAARALVRATGRDCGYGTALSTTELDRLKACWSEKPPIATVPTNDAP